MLGIGRGKQKCQSIPRQVANTGPGRHAEPKRACKRLHHPCCSQALCPPRQYCRRRRPVVAPADIIRGSLEPPPAKSAPASSEAPLSTTAGPAYITNSAKLGRRHHQGPRATPACHTAKKRLTIDIADEICPLANPRPPKRPGELKIVNDRVFETCPRGCLLTPAPMARPRPPALLESAFTLSALTIPDAWPDPRWPIWLATRVDSQAAIPGTPVGVCLFEKRGIACTPPPTRPMSKAVRRVPFPRPQPGHRVKLVRGFFSRLGV